MIATTTMLLMLINGARLKPLQSDANLVTMATQHCTSMANFSHDDFFKTYSKLINANYKYAGENLAVGFNSPKEIFTALENSKTHHDNNHSTNYQKIGIATCQKAPGVWLTVFLFAGSKFTK